MGCIFKYMKKCYTCNINPRTKGKSYCKECESNRSKQYRKLNPHLVTQWNKNRMNKFKQHCGIYLLKCIVTGDFYIGKSTRIPKRIHEHLTDTKRNTSQQIVSLIQKYSHSSFIWGVIEYCDEEILDKKEQYYINKLQPTLNNYGLQ